MMRLARQEKSGWSGIGSIFVIAIVSLIGSDTWSDSIHLKNGSHVIGSVTGVKSGKLVVKTDFSGDISITIDAIEGIETENETGYKLDSGEVLSGKLQFDEGRQELRIGDVILAPSLSAIVAIGDPVALSGPNINWYGRAQFGATLKEGNTEELDLDGLVSTTRESDVGRLTLQLRGEYVEKNDSKTNNAVFGSLKYEHDLTDRSYLVGIAQAEYDEFEELDLRTAAGGGLGYFFIKKEHHFLKGDIGLLYQHEEFEDGTSTDNALLSLGYDYHLDVRERMRFNSQFVYFANLTETDDWRYAADNAIEVPVSSKEGWKVRLGVRNDYDNEPQPGIEEMDTTVYSSLVFDWD